TSSNVIFPCDSVRSLARLLPKDIALPPPACIWRMKKIQTPTRRMRGNHEMNSENQENFSSSGLAETSTFFSTRVSEIEASVGLYVLNSLPSVYLPITSLPEMTTDFTFPASTDAMKSL